MASKNRTPNKFAKNYNSRASTAFFTGRSRTDETPYQQQTRIDFEKARMRHQKCVEHSRVLKGNALMLNEYLQILLEFSLNAGDWYSVNRSAFLGENLKMTTQMGIAINHMGGVELMRSVAAQIPKLDRRELDYAWDGIGGWKA